MKKKALLCAIFLTLFLPVKSVAEKGKSFTVEGFSNFSEGHFYGTSISESGILSIGLSGANLSEFLDNNFIGGLLWQKNLYLADADNSLIKVVNSEDGVVNGEISFDGQLITALAQGKKELYVATGPGAAIYKVNSKNQKTLFINLEENYGYIWNIKPFKDDSILVATGDPAALLKVDKKGSAELIFSSEESHFTALIIDKKERIIVGGPNNGTLYRGKIGASFKSFMSSSFNDISALTFHDGSLYVSVTKGGDKLLKNKGFDDDEVGSKIYRLEEDGSYELIASSSDEIILDLVPGLHGELLITTAASKTSGHGRIYSYDPQKKEIAIAYETKAERINKLIAKDKESFIAITGGGTRLEKISRDYAKSGEYISPIINSGIISKSGNLRLEGNLAAQTGIKVAIRSGLSTDPDNGWSEWSAYMPFPGGKLNQEPALYYQVKILFEAKDKEVPEIYKINLSYLRKNIKPTVLEVLPLAPGLVLELVSSIKSSGESEEAFALDEAQYKEMVQEENSKPVKKKTKIMKRRLKGSQTIAWRAKDPNNDELVHSLYYKEVNEKEWHLLVENHPFTFYAIKPGLLADGRYFFKVISSDLPDNIKENALSGEGLSRLVTVDNTPPLIENVRLISEKKKSYITFTVRDNVSKIGQVSLAFNGEFYSDLEPTDGIADDLTEEYKVEIIPPKKGEKHLLITAEDLFANRAQLKESLK